MNHIEKSGIRRGEYVAHINGAHWVRRVSGGWQTYALASMAGEFTPLHAPTLRAMDKRIGEMRQAPYVPTLSH